MPQSDPIADMLTRIRNAISSVHETVDIPASKLKIQLAEVLKKEGDIESFEVIEENSFSKTIRVRLKYGPRGEKLIQGIKRESKPGLRVYTSKDVNRVLNGLGIAVVSTSQGLMSDRQARKKGIGGELVCTVW